MQEEFQSFANNKTSRLLGAFLSQETSFTSQERKRKIPPWNKQKLVVYLIKCVATGGSSQSRFQRRSKVQRVKWSLPRGMHPLRHPRNRTLLQAQPSARSCAPLKFNSVTRKLRDTFNARRSPPTWRHGIHYNNPCLSVLHFSCISLCMSFVCVTCAHLCTSYTYVYTYIYLSFSSSKVALFICL